MAPAPESAFSIFALPRRFRGETGRLQRNALQSWLALRPRPHVVLLGGEPGVAEICAEYGVECGPAVARNRQGTPLVSDLFRLGLRHAPGPVRAYVNADILLPPRFARVVEVVAAWSGPVLAVGERVDLDVPETLDFADPGLWGRLEQRVAGEGRGVGPGALDYFVFRGDLWPDLPPFAIGRMFWDNWLVWAATRRADVLDVTPWTRVVHQAHGYRHVAADAAPEDMHAVMRTAEGRENLRLAVWRNRLANVHDASHRLGADGVAPNRSLDRWLRRRLGKRAAGRYARELRYRVRDGVRTRRATAERGSPASRGTP